MELWIRSQDKELIQKVNIGIMYLKDATNRDCIANRDNETGFSILGEYKTKERALEVLDEIQDMITLNEHISGDYQTSDLLIKSKFLEHQVKIFVMPKE